MLKESTKGMTKKCHQYMCSTKEIEIVKISGVQNNNNEFKSSLEAFNNRV